MNLSGQWAFELDADDRGVAEAWYNRTLAQQIELPGSLQSQGFGDDVSVSTQWIGDIVDRSWFTEPKYEIYRRPGNVKVPMWLQPEKHYIGPAWYQREIEIPAAWEGLRITLTLERPHWETRVWLDDREIGSALSLSTPHSYNLGTRVAESKHRLTVRVDNRLIINVGPNAHSMSDHTQTAWNGIAGRIELTAGSPVWVRDVQVYPDLARKAAQVRVSLSSALSRPASGTLKLAAASYNSGIPHVPPPISLPITVEPAGAIVEMAYPLGEQGQLWDEFHPALYHLDIDLDVATNGFAYSDQFTTSFGLREVRPQGTQLAINGRQIFLRGTLECCIFPLTGYPPTDLASWKRILGAARAHGLNHLRFHSWCPPEAAFVAADEMGFYYQIECASWANQGASIGRGDPLDEWLYQEGERITTTYGNHPSFIMMAYGDEPAGDFETYLGKWVTYWKAHDPRRVYTSGAGWPAMPENQYHNIPAPRIQAWGAGLKSRINARPPETRTDYTDTVRRYAAPIVSHEIGQWCVYPNFAEIDKYRGVLKAKNFEIFRDQLVANHMGDQATDFLMASGKLQTLCYKEEIESALRTPGFGGFQLLDLHDFPGQGTALVGVLDPFWDSKGYVTPQEFSRFCNYTVPLARMDQRIWTTGETFNADIDVAHFGPETLAEAVVYWRLLRADGAVAAEGSLPPSTIPTGADTHVGAICADLSGFAPAQKYRLVVGIEGTGVENDWDIWVFSEQVPTSAADSILVTGTLNDTAIARLNAGGRVLLMVPGEAVKTSSQIGFSSVFWNTAWTRNQAPHTLGVLCDPAHPVFAQFPTEYHSNWQWWELIHGAGAMMLDSLPANLRPLVQPIDTWFENRRLGLLFEARVAGGRLMVCSMDLGSDLKHRPVARQMRYSLLHYMDSDRFNPGFALDAGQIRALFHEVPANA